MMNKYERRIDEDAWGRGLRVHMERFDRYFNSGFRKRTHAYGERRIAWTVESNDGIEDISEVEDAPQDHRMHKEHTEASSQDY